MADTYKLVTLAFFSAFFLLHKAALSQNDCIEEETVLHLTSGPDNPRNSEGSFVTLKDGRILFVYSRFTGSSSGDFDPAYLAGRYSSDNGKTWTEKDTFFAKEEGGINVMSVSIIRLQNGNLALLYLSKKSPDDCIPVMRISVDEGENWSEPKPVITDQDGYFVVVNDRPIQLSSGRIVVPTSLHKTKDTKYSNSGILRCYYSDDNGQTWETGLKVPAPDSVITQEPGVIELKDGRVMMFIRANGGKQYQSFSDDKGVSWSMAAPSLIRSPLSPASIKRVSASGNLVLVWNDNGETGPGYYKAKRTPLTLAVSKDEGISWIPIANIENNPEEQYAYTAIHEVDGHILLGYYVGPGPDKKYSLKIKRVRLCDF